MSLPPRGDWSPRQVEEENLEESNEFVFLKKRDISRTDDDVGFSQSSAPGTRDLENLFHD